MTSNYTNPATGITDPSTASVAVVLLDPTIARPVRETVTSAFGQRLRDGSREALREAAFALAVGVRTLPATDPWRLSGCQANPYDGLATDVLLHWGESEYQHLVHRWDGVPDEGRALLWGTGTVIRIERALAWTAPSARGPAWGDALAALWRRLSHYGVTVPQLAMVLDATVGLRHEDLTTNEADRRARLIRPPAGLVPVVTAWSFEPAPIPEDDGDFENPPF